MKYKEFKKRYANIPFFTYLSLKQLGVPIQPLRNRVSYWKKQGLIIQLKRGFFALSDADRKSSSLSLDYLACELVTPSYISLEYALSIYGLIPEKVNAITLITTKKTQSYNNDFGQFIYRHIKTGAYSGYYQAKTQQGCPYFIALKEKAIVDFLYLNLHQFIKDNDPMQVFEHNFRFQNLDDCNLVQLKKYAILFGSKKLLRVVDILIDYIKFQKE